MKKIRLMKKISVFICIVTLLFGSVPSFAADYSLADKADASAVKYYILTDENTETETDDFSEPGNYRVRSTVHNYGESGTINLVLMAGVFDRETHELKNVNFAEKSIAAGETAELAADVRAKRAADPFGQKRRTARPSASAEAEKSGAAEPADGAEKTAEKDNGQE